ncbi:MAG: type III pantothenate kinase [Desulfovibrio sp.]|nr:type III pantothenate kinase [Desulfovibrio sp.]
MRPELMLFDVGNTSVKVSLATREGLLATYALPSDARQTADGFGLALLGLLRHAGCEGARLEACVACSVVPGMDAMLRDAAERWLACPLLFAPGDVNVPIENRYDSPSEVGADRITGAFAARRLFPDAPSIIVADFGTALTFDCVSGQAYLGGLIFPGPMTAMAALAGSTAKLPPVSLDIAETEPRPGRSTAVSMQHGLAFGFAALVEGLCAKLSRQMPGPVKIISTGGYGRALARICPVLEDNVPALVSDGLRILYSEHMQNKGA